MNHDLILALMFFAAAVLYSSVGHAGASGYLAAMAFMAVAPPVMKPTALTLNLLVATIGTIRFMRAGYFSWATLWPFLIGSVPFAFLGGALQLSGHLYKAAVGVILVLSSIRLVIENQRKTPIDAGVHEAPLPAAIGWGGFIGLLAGITGTGGGIFLSPLLLLTGWADTRKTAGISAAFILANSVAGLAGNLASIGHLPRQIWIWVLAAGIGGFIGSHLGSRVLAPKTLRYLLSLVLLIAGLKLILAR